jgi:hypothetical protein
LLLHLFFSCCAGGTFLPQQWGNPSTRQFAQPVELVVELAGIVLQGIQGTITFFSQKHVGILCFLSLAD